jgi:hypothetical protein
MCTYVSQYHKGCWHKVLIVTETNRCPKARRNGFDCPKTEDTICIDAETEGVCEFCGELGVEMLEEEREEREKLVKGNTRPKEEKKRTKWRRWFGKWKSRDEVRDVVDDLYLKLASVGLGVSKPQRSRGSTW